MFRVNSILKSAEIKTAEKFRKLIEEKTENIHTRRNNTLYGIIIIVFIMINEFTNIAVKKDNYVLFHLDT